LFIAHAVRVGTEGAFDVVHGVTGVDVVLVAGVVATHWIVSHLHGPSSVRRSVVPTGHSGTGHFDLSIAHNSGTGSHLNVSHLHGPLSVRRSIVPTGHVGTGHFDLSIAHSNGTGSHLNESHLQAPPSTRILLKPGVQYVPIKGQTLGSALLMAQAKVGSATHSRESHSHRPFRTKDGLKPCWQTISGRTHAVLLKLDGHTGSPANTGETPKARRTETSKTFMAFQISCLNFLL
jgi:hypothetical protein